MFHMRRWQRYRDRVQKEKSKGEDMPLLFGIEKISGFSRGVQYAPAIHEGIVFQNKRMRRVLSPCSVIL